MDTTAAARRDAMVNATATPIGTILGSFLTGWVLMLTVGAVGWNIGYWPAYGFVYLFTTGAITLNPRTP